MSDQKQSYLRKAERRAMIARAARALILENGYAALRTRDVAARVGINISTLHFHVPGKEALVELVAETTRDAFLALLPPAPDPGAPARAQLRAEARAYHDSLRDQPDLAACFVQLTQIAGTTPQVAALLEGFTRDWCARYAAILEIGRAQGVFRADLHPLPAALAVTGALSAFGPRGPEGLAMFWPVFDEIERGLLTRSASEGDDA
ncbi:TetR/AcrR family transcriptional regulator [Pseudooceanicola sp. CBS1P-1]|uniref:TetR family transcriptional regulator n=1 Tax=Pseudooceanicola albus TaxID=2692189 RepID=A0A6L7FXE5_9RHOB|nr:MULTISPECIES: TetR/AcrR family transcriptional regulator [Pseudooceanicola]MBT9382241.1 TetR/AcrR family transcriptional regulator [Pseudooceanicola endophyticus]MXN16784.1 TetR family transcriptional regulator [Pseudooceanicola albus]